MKATAPQDALYRLVVKNTGDVALQNLVVSDATLGLVNVAVPGTLNPGASLTITSATSGFSKLDQPNRCPNPGTFSNTAQVNASSATGQAVTSTDPAVLQCFGQPAIDLEKQVSVDGGNTFKDADTEADAALANVPSGGAQYRLIIRNVGTQDLKDIKVSDATLGLVNVLVPGTLAAGDSVTVTSADFGFEKLNQPDRCSAAGKFTNIAEVKGTAVQTLQVVNDTDPAVVVCRPACLVIIDEEGIDNDIKTIEAAAASLSVTADFLVNDDRPTEFGNPDLRWNELGAGDIVVVPSGQLDDEGWFAPPTRPIQYADSSNAVGAPTDYDEWIRRYVEGSLAQKNLDKVRNVMPLRNNTLRQLVGRTCVAVVHDSDISMNYKPIYGNLQGDRYGLFYFTVLGTQGPGTLVESGSSSSLIDMRLRVESPFDITNVEPFQVPIIDQEP